MITLGVRGVGRWGPNILRNFAAMAGVKIKAVCDLDKKRLMHIEKRFQDIQLFTDPQNILKDKAVDCIVIATSLSSHYPLAKMALESGHHVFEEKPLATTSQECEELINIADRKNKTLFIGHTFKYNAGIRAVKEYIDSDELGTLYLIDSNRTNLGPVRYDTNALWDLASHDISIFSYWLDEIPKTVSAIGTCFLNEAIEDVVYVTLGYKAVSYTHLTLPTKTE